MNFQPKSSRDHVTLSTRLVGMESTPTSMLARRSRHLTRAAAGLTLLIASAAASAVDGCQVLLCLAGNWRSIQQCVPPVIQVLKDLARGKAFPKCDLGGSS